MKKKKKKSSIKFIRAESEHIAKEAREKYESYLRFRGRDKIKPGGRTRRGDLGPRRRLRRSDAEMHDPRDTCGNSSGRTTLFSSRRVFRGAFQDGRRKHIIHVNFVLWNLCEVSFFPAHISPVKLLSVSQQLAQMTQRQQSFYLSSVTSRLRCWYGVIKMSPVFFTYRSQLLVHVKNQLNVFIFSHRSRITIRVCSSCLFCGRVYGNVGRRHNWMCIMTSWIRSVSFYGRGRVRLISRLIGLRWLSLGISL